MRNKFIAAFAAVLLVLFAAACAPQSSVNSSHTEIDGLAFSESAELSYAEGFSIDRYEGGYSLITTRGGKFLLVPEDKEAPQNLSGDITVLKQPVGNIYLAATADMTFFDALGNGSAIRFSSIKKDDWYIDYAKKAMENGEIIYAGKYREPDYELLLSEGCRLSVQSTMIDHTPEVKEKLEELGITVFTDYSSYENHPLGRSEWVKVYGEMTGTPDRAEELFEEQEQRLAAVNGADKQKTVAFFYIDNAGRIQIRRADDYIMKMLQLAGGENVFASASQKGTSASFPIDAEQFYTLAKDADIIIYNSSLGGKLTTVDELIAKYELLSDFRAVKDGMVWRTEGSLFQETLNSGVIIEDFNRIFSGDGETGYVTRLEGGDTIE